MCFSFESHQLTQNEPQPYHSDMFQKMIQKDTTVFPIAVLIYMDDVVKFRTKSKSTCGIYYTLLNWDSQLCSSMESIRLLGFWEFADKLMNEIKQLNGFTLTVIHPSTGQEIPIRIEVAGFIWDTIEKWFSLQLMKDECSRCLETSSCQHLTPNILYGASLCDPDFTVEPKSRKILEMKEIIPKIPEIKRTYQQAYVREKCYGMNFLTLENMKVLYMKLSKTKRNQLLKTYSTCTPIDNPFLKYPEVIDPFCNSRG
ncbi:hypothetical protein C9374_001719 [Naegleria lovaniensis]|uniref:Uncharacterized protein n=1 Tax=Naegleria lovaniensis TaxID=51637 RepID=A0AA88KRK5_NAELO|nr:uncharacterized protein C9374_001719 [Naegleria lovaniensis]KAG2387387.1 hypothetical protein C9374_001719 [Naegleria lovaniensis]